MYLQRKKGSAKKKELIKAVNLVTWSANVKYSIQIYRNPKDGRPTSGTKMLKRPVTGTIREAGTHTIDLSRKAEVLRGDKFAVVVKLRSLVRLVLMKMMIITGYLLLIKQKKDRVIFMIIENGMI